MTLPERMKEHEGISKTTLEHKVPVIVRIDGRAFHTYTRLFVKPFDIELSTAMQDTTMYLCRSIPGCVFGYTQSDEISLVLTDYKNADTSSWFDYEVQKLCSVIASMATAYFNTSIGKLRSDLSNNLENLATFDARVFNLPVYEVNNYFIWRQRDAIRNSIATYAQSFFSQKELNGKSSKDMLDMLKEQGRAWDSLSHSLRYGLVAYKQLNEGDIRARWHFSEETPLFEEDIKFMQGIMEAL